MKKIKVHFSNIKWDVDKKCSLRELGLRDEFIKEIEVEDFNREEIEDFLSDWLSNEFGFCHCGFNFEILE